MHEYEDKTLGVRYTRKAMCGHCEFILVLGESAHRHVLLSSNVGLLFIMGGRFLPDVLVVLVPVVALAYWPPLVLRSLRLITPLLRGSGSMPCLVFMVFLLLLVPEAVGIECDDHGV